ncbi:efflux RND transporter periplasmic adaptor subunit [Thalassotalea sp. M1531]|uniref:Efflux RND transporter periplasmic adaptor subunit n=1 Tax=Thalassotalea algicola TaxID=2716224 RepID=A0A7Y0LD56_9GAMM|nr:efflux RND transporter periplasmic adaptor subunit [Thalassotalea algicola]NMP31947.1 efflux RND transporter periplasmic adaptor subunit [Thalassotalea algicola]
MNKLLKQTLFFLGVGLSSAALANTPAPSPVKVDKVTSVSLEATANLMGTIYSKMHVPMTAGISGRVEWVAEPGSFVKAGEPLVKMDMLPLELRKAEQVAQMKRAQINVKYLFNEVERLQKLRKTNAASQFQLDQTKSQYDLALADNEIAELKRKQIDDQIARATVNAPYDGVVTERVILAGTDVNRSDVISKFLDTEHLEARVYIPIKYLAFLRRGNEINLSNEQQQITAPITAVIPSADPRSQTFEVRVEIPNHANSQWAAGQLVKVTVPVQKADPSLTVHRDALILRKDGTYVVKVNADNTVKRLPVTVGKGSFDRVAIVGELGDGDTVAIRGAERLRDGQSVVIN